MIDQENSLDIKLGTETLEFLQSLPEKYCAANYQKVRKVVANVVDFQNRFARPMPNPFTQGQDLEKTLETPKPLSLLKKYKIALQIPGDNSIKLDFDDGITESDITYCFLGGKTWKQNVEAGIYKDDDAKEIELSSFKWLKDLFEILEVASDFDYERKNVARGIASCWYNVCCQIDFSVIDENEPEIPFDASSLVETLTTGMAMKMGDLLDNPDLLDDDSQDADYNPELDMDEEDSDEEDSDDEDYEEEVEEIDADEVEGLAEEASEVQEMSVINENEEKPREEDDDMPVLLNKENEVITDLDDLPIAPEAIELRETIFRVVDKLQAFMPDPDTALPWFKRCLKHIRTAQQTADMTWYPWGSPPMEKLISALKGEDPYAKGVAAHIILLFQQQLTQAAQDYEEDYDEYDEEEDEEEETTTSTTTTNNHNS